MKNYIKFSSYLEDAMYFTQIDLETSKIQISEDGHVVVSDSLAEFKKAVALEQTIESRLYADILDMAEKLIEMLSEE